MLLETKYHCEITNDKNSSVKIGDMVSNELLHKAFSIFGEIERCVVGIDARGRSTNEAIVEFEKKPCALECVKRCTEGCFFLTTSLRPVIAEIQEEAEDDGGLQEAMLPKRNQEYHGEREVCIFTQSVSRVFRSFPFPVIFLN